MLPTSAGIEPVTSWSPVGRRIQLSHQGRLLLLKWRFCDSEIVIITNFVVVLYLYKKGCLFHVYAKYWNTLTPNHTCPKICLFMGKENNCWMTVQHRPCSLSSAASSLVYRVFSSQSVWQLGLLWYIFADTLKKDDDLVFISLWKLFKSYQDDVRVIIKFLALCNEALYSHVMNSASSGIWTWDLVTRS